MYSTMVKSGGLRYCINYSNDSIYPLYDKLEELGYGDLIPHFEKNRVTNYV